MLSRFCCGRDSVLSRVTHGGAAVGKVGRMNPLTKILQLIAGPDLRGSAELKAALAEIDTKALARTVDKLEAERRHQLVHGDDATVQAVSAKIAAASLEVERATAAAEELAALITAAEAREAAAALEAQTAEARAAKERLGAIYAEVDELVAKAKARLGAAARECEALSASNARFEKANRSDLRVKYSDISAVRQGIVKALR